MKIDELESKVWYRVVKVIYLGAYGLAVLAILLFAYLGFPKEIVDDDKSFIVCNNGQRYPATTGGLYITYLNYISDWERAYTLCNNNQPPLYTENSTNETGGLRKILKPPESNFKLELARTLNPSWPEYIKYLLITCGVIFIVMEILKRVFLYVVVGKPDQKDE